MSYIRATSNPEGLYAFSSTDDKTGRMKAWLLPGWRHKERKLTNVNNDNPMLVPQAVFDKVVKKWSDDRHDERGVRFKGFSVREVLVYMDDGSLVSEGQHPAWQKAEEFHGQPMRESEHLVRVAYKDKWMLLWGVTWDFVVRNVVDGFEFKKRKRKKAKAR